MYIILFCTFLELIKRKSLIKIETKYLLAHKILYMLLEIFPESDKSCKDITRMFFGGNDLKFVDSNATINLVDISLSLQAYLKSRYST